MGELNMALSLAFLFFVGSSLGWCLELVFRKFFSSSNPEHRWINPGFCVGPYVPLYGFGLCILFLFAYLGDYTGLGSTTGGKIALFVAMAVSMTVIEYIAGIMLLKLMKLRLWDYSKLKGNIQGLICPQFSAIWAAMGAAYYFLVHPYILEALVWLSNNLAFSFFIGQFFGVFIIDVAYSSHLFTKLKAFADENDVVVRYEHLKAEIREAQKKKHFVFAFNSERSLNEHLHEAHAAIEQIRRKNKEPKSKAKKTKDQSR